MLSEARDRHVEDVLREDPERIRRGKRSRNDCPWPSPWESHLSAPSAAVEEHREYVTFFDRLSRDGLSRCTKYEPPCEQRSSVRGALYRRGNVPGKRLSDRLLLRWFLPWQPVRRKQTDAGCVRRGRYENRPSGAGLVNRGRPHSEQQHRRVLRSDLPAPVPDRSRSDTP